MTWWLPHNFNKKKDALLLRAEMMTVIRQFFDSRHYIGVETPVLQVMPCADAHIHGFKTEYFRADLKKEREYYLQTSPEFSMKKLLVAGCERIYQICPVFRNAESGNLHSPEFTILEWYRVGANYIDVMDELENLFEEIIKILNIDAYTYKGRTVKSNLKWERISIEQVFDMYANIDLGSTLNDTHKFKALATKVGVRTTDKDQWDDVFHAIMTEKIEPYLGMDMPTILYDYPSDMAALSRKKPSDPRWAERFELYICGVELCNAFTELTDAAEQRLRFAQEMQAKECIYGFSYDLDEDFLLALEHGMPECAGIAVGLDRLTLLLSKAKVIDDVLWAGKP